MWTPETKNLLATGMCSLWIFMFWCRDTEQITSLWGPGRIGRQPASSSQPVLRRRGSCDVHAASQRVPRSRGGPWRRGGPSWRSTRAQQGRGARLGRPLRAVEALQHVVRWVPRKHLRPSRVQLNPLHFGDSNWNGDNYPLTSPIV